MRILIEFLKQEKAHRMHIERTSPNTTQQRGEVADYSTSAVRRSVQPTKGAQIESATSAGVVGNKTVRIGS